MLKMIFSSYRFLLIIRNHFTRSCIYMYAPAHIKSAAKVRHFFDMRKFLMRISQKTCQNQTKNATRKDGVI